MHHAHDAATTAASERSRAGCTSSSGFDGRVACADFELFRSALLRRVSSLRLEGSGSRRGTASRLGLQSIRNATAAPRWSTGALDLATMMLAVQGLDTAQAERKVWE